jgi:RNA polymerase sigma-70 factor (ECF subfamily)
MTMRAEGLTITAADDDPEQAFRALYASHYRSVYRMAFAVLLDGDEARDVAQEVFVRFHDRFHRIERPAVHAWLRTVTVREALSTRRRLAAWFRREARVESSDPTPESAASRNEMVNKLRACLSLLGKRQRTLLALHFDEDLSPSEIAQVLGATANATRVALHRALGQLRAVATTQGLELPEEG